MIGGSWDVAWLGSNVGYLYGFVYATWTGNTVLTGHVWNADNSPGIFANLRSLKYGDRFEIRAFGQVFTYEVQENKRIDSQNIAAVFQSEDLNWVTLLTCEGYNPIDNDYDWRRIVKAILVNVALAE